jgi:hypothetical protein
MNKILQKSDYLIMAAALFSMILSIVLWFSDFRDEGLFVGIWVPSILAFGVYFKLAVMRKQDEIYATRGQKKNQ